jgi:hypothetical protein
MFQLFTVFLLFACFFPYLSVSGFAPDQDKVQYPYNQQLRHPALPS